MVMTVLYIGGSRDTLRLVPVQNHRAGEPGQSDRHTADGSLNTGRPRVIRGFRFRGVLFGSRGGLGFRLGLALGLSILDSSRFRLSSFSGFGRVYLQLRDDREGRGAGGRTADATLAGAHRTRIRSQAQLRTDTRGTIRANPPCYIVACLCLAFDSRGRDLSRDPLTPCAPLNL